MGDPNQRQHKRFSRRYPVRFGSGNTSLMGFTIDLSSGGLGISGKKGMKPPAILELDLAAPGGHIALKGQVRWCQRVARGHVYLFEMGVQIIERSQAYIDLLENLICESESKDHLLGDFHEDLSVTYETQRELLDEYNKNISQDGIFIPTDASFRPMQDVQFTIHLLEVMRVIHAEGRVVFVADQAHADQVGGKPGVALQILRYYFEDAALLDSFIDTAKQKYSE